MLVCVKYKPAIAIARLFTNHKQKLPMDRHSRIKTKGNSNSIALWANIPQRVYGIIWIWLLSAAIKC